MGLRDYAHCNPEVETCIPRDYGITGLHTFWPPSISNYEQKITGLRNPEIVTCFFMALRD